MKVRVVKYHNSGFFIWEVETQQYNEGWRYNSLYFFKWYAILKAKKLIKGNKPKIAFEGNNDGM